MVLLFLCEFKFLILLNDMLFLMCKPMINNKVEFSELDMWVCL